MNPEAAFTDAIAKAIRDACAAGLDFWLLDDIMHRVWYGTSRDAEGHVKDVDARDEEAA